jgi:hypothetical protein
MMYIPPLIFVFVKILINNKAIKDFANNIENKRKNRYRN